MRRLTRVWVLTAIALFTLAAPAGAQIIYDHGLDIWAMNDDGSGQHALIGALTVPGITDLDEPAVDPNGTTLAFVGEWAGANVESTRWNPDAPGACGANCEGVYTLVGGAIKRLSPDPLSCPLNPCGSFDANPQVASDGDVLWEFSFYNDPSLCGSPFVYWCVDLVGADLYNEPATGGNRTQIPTPCDTPSTPSGTLAGQPEKVAVNPANAQQIAYADCHDPTSHDPMVQLGSRDGATHTPLLFDDQDFASVAFTPDGSHIITLENGDNPGIWDYPIAGPIGPTDQVLADPMNVTFATPREISGHRIAFIADKNVWTVPDTCTSATCTYPTNATQLTTDGTSLGLTWTALSVPAPGGGTGAPSGGGTGTTPTTPTTATTPTTPTPTTATTPAVTKLKLASTSIKSGKTTTLTYTDSEAATMTFVINRANKGKRKGSKCVKPTRALRHARSCTYYTKVKSLSHKDVAGANKLTFSTKGLKAGTYQLVGTPRSSSGKAGKPITITFHVK